MRRAAAVLAAAASALAAAAPAPGADRAGGSLSLPQVNGPRPGPDLLYAPAARAPQLENAGVWQAPPILVSGATAYRSGEFLYQDFLYDDHGAKADRRDPSDPRSGNDTFSAPNGTYTYPAAAPYAMNAADLVELRVRPLADATAFRVTLNTLVDPELVAFTIALGSSDQPRPLPHGANATAPAQLFATVHGTTADLRDAATGAAVAPAPSVAVDVPRRQFDVRIPHAAWSPGTGKVRVAAAVGLWDRANGRYLIPGDTASETRPGGAGSLASPTAFFNVAFRRACTARGQQACEPLPDIDRLEHNVDPAWWRDKQQGAALRTGDLAPFAAEIDFARLAAGAQDDSGVPRDGSLNRIFASRSETAQGIDFSVQCGGTAACLGEYRGRLQTYALYVPRRPQPTAGWGTTLLLHSLGGNHNQYAGSRNQSQFGDRGPGSVVITPLGRGPDGWYYDHAGADTFEAWADVARHYQLDPDWTAIAGYSMGGYGTYKFATQFPDLFAKGQPTVGPPTLGVSFTARDSTSSPSSSTYFMLPSLRNVPFLIWNAVQDELVPFSGAQAQADRFGELGLRYAFDAFQPAEHFTLAYNDQYQPAADFLGTSRVDRDPPHVTYVVNPTMDFAALGTRADHAYWLSALTLRDSAGATPRATVDARSRGFGVGDPEPTGVQSGGGSLTGGTSPAIPYTRQAQDWKAAPAEPRRNVLELKATNLATATVDPGRARVGCDATITAETDGPLTLDVAGCRRTIRFPAGRSTSEALCIDRARPRSRVRSARVSRRLLTVRGTARDRGCRGGGAPARPVPGIVARVRVAVARQVGRRCSFVRRTGRLGKRRACRRPVWLAARGRTRWALRMRARLPRGRYLVRSRAVDGRGNRERPGPRNRRRVSLR